MSFADAVSMSGNAYPPDAETIQVAILLAENSLKVLSDYLTVRAPPQGRNSQSLQTIIALLADNANYENETWLSDGAAVASFDYAVDHTIMSFSIVVSVWGSPSVRPSRSRPRKVLSVRQTVQTIGTIVGNIPPCGQGYASAHRKILVSALLEPQPAPELGTPLYVVDHIKQISAVRDAEHKARIERERIRISESYGQKYIAVPPKNLESVDEVHSELYLQAMEETAMARLAGEFEDQEDEI
jgi:hypothetical protein